MEDFFNYWDNVMAYWIENGKMPESEAYWSEQNIDLLPELMPAPYLGDPEYCSALILNYNPGAHFDFSKPGELEKFNNCTGHHNQLGNPRSLAGAMSHRYREINRRYFDFSDPTLPQNFTDVKGNTDGPKWWIHRKKWIDALLPVENGNNPFAIELCAWGSNRWGNIKYNKKLLSELKSRLAQVIEEVICRSDLRVGICVGTQWGDHVLKSFGYKDVTSEFTDFKNRGWKPCDDRRNYRILRNDNHTYILNTWKSKGFDMMGVPEEKPFRAFEKDIIEKIKAHK